MAICNRVVFSFLIFLFSVSVFADEFRKSVDALYDHRYKEAAMNLEKLALKDNPNALFLLATLYHSGENGQQDEKTALKLYHKAAELGHVLAQEYLVAGYQEGWFGLKKNKRKAKFWRKKLESNPQAAPIPGDQISFLKKSGFYETKPAVTVVGRAVQIQRDGDWKTPTAKMNEKEFKKKEQLKIEQARVWGWDSETTGENRELIDRTLSFYRNAAKSGNQTAQNYLENSYIREKVQ